MLTGVVCVYRNTAYEVEDGSEDTEMGYTVVAGTSTMGWVFVLGTRCICAIDADVYSL